MRSKIYRDNKARAAFSDQTPTTTDQSGARDTDINIIIGRYGIGNTAPGHSQPGTFADYSELPTDLRGMIEKARELGSLRDRLPAEYQNMTTDELLSAPPEKLLKITKDAETVRTRRSQLPEHLRRISDQDILGWTPEQFQGMLPSVHPTTQPLKETK